MKSILLNKISPFYWFVIICSILCTIQSIVIEGYRYFEIKALILPFVGNCALLFCCFVHWLLGKYISSKLLRIIDWSFIIVNCLLFIWGLSNGDCLFKIWTFILIGIVYSFSALL